MNELTIARIIVSITVIIVFLLELACLAVLLNRGTYAFVPIILIAISVKVWEMLRIRTYYKENPNELKNILNRQS